MLDLTRRRAIAAIATIGLAGCLGGDEDIEEDVYGDWFSGANNFEGTADRTDVDEPAVLVGAPTDFSFDPAAIRVEVGSTVVWEWSGDGGRHDVYGEDGVFESALVADAGHTFSHTFDEAGVYRYVCTPHQTGGMVGAVHVVE